MKKKKSIITINTLHLAWIVPAIQMIFIILKVTSFIDWTWYLVLSPLLIVIACTIIFICIVAIIAHEAVEKEMLRERDEVENIYRSTKQQPTHNGTTRNIQTS